MRKVLLATTAIIGFAVAGAAQAATAPGATSPITVNVGGDVDFLAGAFHASDASNDTSGLHRANDAFETLYSLNFDINGKAGNGLQYGGKLTMDNNPDISNAFGGNANNVQFDQAYIFLSGAFGKVDLGNSHGATDLALLAPVVGEGQVYGRYIDFLSTTSYAKNFVAGVDVTDHSSNITYFTPKVGNEQNKVQVGVSFVPNFYDYGSNTILYKGSSGANSNGLSPYQNVVKGAAAYTGTFNPVTVGASADIITGSANNVLSNNQTWLLNATTGKKVRDFTSLGFGAQAAAEGFTLGGNYLDQGHYDTILGQTKKQQEYGAGLKYEFNKVGVGVSYLGGEGYSNLLSMTTPGTGSGFNYVKDFASYGLGGTYTWAPGLTSNLDGVMFSQKTDSDTKNDGYVLLVSQKLAF